MAALVPYDVIREIVSFVQDIDVRRAFGVFNKLNAKEHEHLNYVMRRPIQTWRPWPDWVLLPVEVHYQRYCLQNRVDVREPDIRDDTIDVVMHIKDKEVRYYFYMFRLLHSEQQYIHYHYSLS